MSYVAKTIGVNEEYFVHEDIFIQKIKRLLDWTAGVHLANPPIVKLNEDKSNVDIKVNFHIEKYSELGNFVNFANKEIENIVQGLISNKPNNIELFCLGQKASN